jgi:hypothetical protein
MFRIHCRRLPTSIVRRHNSTRAEVPLDKPSEFYVGVLDLFGVLLPGAVATALLEPRIGDMIFGSLVSRLSSEPAKWAAFLLIAYFLGHLIFLLGSYLDPWYDKLKKRDKDKPMKRFDTANDDSAFLAATAVRDSILTEQERIPLNTFQWARSVLLATCPAAAQDVHRLEADSKFFRSLLVVSTLAALLLFIEYRLVESAMAFVLVVPCFARYFERRLKSTTQAYIHVVTLHRIGCFVRDPKLKSDA